MSFVFAANRNVKGIHCNQIEHKKIASISILYGFFGILDPKCILMNRCFHGKWFFFLVSSTDSF